MLDSNLRPIENAKDKKRIGCEMSRPLNASLQWLGFRQMKTISSTEDFKVFYREPQVVLLAFFGWSKRGLKSLKFFEEWEREWRATHPDSAVAFYCFDQARNPNLGGMYFGLVRNEKGMTSGFGAVAWIRNRKSIGLVPSAIRTGKTELSRLTYERFGKVKAA